MPVAILNVDVFLETIFAFAVLGLFAGGITFYIIGTEDMKKKSLYMGIAGLVLLVIFAVYGYYLDGLRFFAGNILIPVIFYFLAVIIGMLIGAIWYILMILK